MTLRRRFTIAAIAGVVIIIAMVLVLVVQFSRTVSANAAVNDQLSPAADNAAELTLAQADAGRALSIATLLDRGESVQEYRTSIGRATTLLKQIDDSITDDERHLSELVLAAGAAQQAWVDASATPVVSALDAGRRSKAMKALGSDRSFAAYQAMTSASMTLDHAINDRRTQAVRSATGFASLLGAILVVIGLVVVAMAALVVIGIQRWVLDPLEQIRDDLTRAAHDAAHTTPIRTVGPPELMAVAQDGERLRRDLVKEIDEAQAAREGLIQDAPLVAAMQAELMPRSLPATPGLLVSGSSMASEGVIAGDWWEVLPASDGSTVLVVADVSGHDPLAGVIAVRVRAILRATLLSGAPLSAACEQAAAAMVDPAHFVTAIIARIDPRAGSLTWCNAGHVPGIVVTHDKQAFTCDPTGPLLSCLGGQWGARTRSFDPGDAFLAFTDGLVEAQDAAGAVLDESTLMVWLRGLDAPVREAPDELVERTLAHVRHRAAQWHRDDVTVVAASRPR